MFEDMNDSIDFDQEALPTQYTSIMGGEISSSRVLYDVPRGTDIGAAQTLASLQGAAGDDRTNIAMQRSIERPGSTPWTPQDSSPHLEPQDPISHLERQQAQLFDKLHGKLETWQAGTREMIHSTILAQMDRKLQSVSHQQMDEYNKLVLEVRAQVQSGVIKAQQLTEKSIHEDLNPQADMARDDRERLRLAISGNQDKLEVQLNQQHMETVARIQECQDRTCHKIDAMGETLKESMESLAIAVTAMNSSVTVAQEKMMERLDRFQTSVTESLAAIQARHNHDMDSISHRLEQNLQKHDDSQQTITQMGRNLERIMYDYTRPDQAVGMDRCSPYHGSIRAESYYQAEPSQHRELPSNREKKVRESSYLSKRSSKGPRKQVLADTDSSSSSNSSDSDSDTEDSDGSIQTGRLGRSKHKNHRSQRSHKGLKSNPFDGSEKWKVWYKRFKVGTKKWRTSEKLDAMLQLMKGKAADFVFDQLPDETLQDYGALKAELKNRYRKVENPETFAVMFANRSQQATESVQDFAAELTMLYDKAHPHRDARTRREDLRRRWLDGVRDRKAAKQVEFVKNPRTMEEAIDAFVKLQGLNSGSHVHKASKVANFYDSDSDSNQQQETQDVRFTRSSGGGNISQGQNNPQGFNNQNQRQNGNYNNFPRQQFNRQSQQNSQQGFQQSNQGQYYNQQPPRNYGSPRRSNGYQQGNQNFQSRSGNNQQTNPQSRAGDFKCFNCGGLNHMAKNCPTQVASSQTRYNAPPSMPTDGLSLYGGQLRQPAGISVNTFDGIQPSPQLQQAVTSPLSMYQMPPAPLSPPYQAQNSTAWNTATTIQK